MMMVCSVSRLESSMASDSSRILASLTHSSPSTMYATRRLLKYELVNARNACTHARAFSCFSAGGLQKGSYAVSIVCWNKTLSTIGKM